MNPKRIGIIGIRGGYGSFLERFFLKYGCEVIGSDVGSELYNEEVVKRSDVVIFSVPVLDAMSVIANAVAYSRSDQLWVDVSSLKGGTIDAMRASKAEVVGLHGLGAPPKEGVSLEGQTMMIWKPRPLPSEWDRWIASFLEKVGARTVIACPSAHDGAMLINQNLIHDLAIVFPLLARRLELRPADLHDLATPLAARQYGIVAKVLSNPNPRLYGNIQIGNRRTLEMLDYLVETVMKIRECVKDGDVERYAAMLGEAKEYLGPEFIAKALESEE